jgi:alanine racemase
MKTNEKHLIWSEIHLDAIASNVRALKRLLPPGCRLMAVVKANGYGHGAVRVARTALENGAEQLAVARLAEGVELRRAGVRAPILLFGYTPPENLQTVFSHDLTPTVYSFETARAYSAKAESAGRQLAVHLKIDTGMGRLGVLPNGLSTAEPSSGKEAELVEDIAAIDALPNIRIEGVYTHFAAADSADKSYAHRQFDMFQSILDQLAASGLAVELRHAANSAATIELPKSHLDMVRPGISIYGFYPSHEVDRDIVTLKPAMTLKTRIIQLKKVPPGFHISYGMSYTTDRPTTIATVPLGYADGYSRKLSSRGTMLVRGVRVPIVGRVCMDLTMLDVGAVPGVKMEDEVVAFGRQGASEITADEVAAMLETINYEIVSSLTARVPKVYK